MNARQGFFGAPNGITLNASANQARGNADGADVVQRDARIGAGSNPGQRDAH